LPLSQGRLWLKQGVALTLGSARQHQQGHRFCNLVRLNMSNHEEEQALEIEALESIFEEGKELTKISETEFLIKLVPFPAGEEENHVGVTMHIVYTADYPDSPPEWSLDDAKLPDDKLGMLQAAVEEVITSSLVMAMVYTMAEACQDFLKQHNQKVLSMHEEMLQRMGQTGEGDQEEVEDDASGDDEDADGPSPEEEWKGLAEKALCPEVDRITTDSFAKWKTKFDQEMVACGILKREENKAKSGKQIFLDTQKQKDSAPDATDGNGKPDTLVYDAALFGEDGMDDLDDLSGGDD